MDSATRQRSHARAEPQRSWRLRPGLSLAAATVLLLAAGLVLFRFQQTSFDERTGIGRANEALLAALAVETATLDASAGATLYALTGGPAEAATYADAERAAVNARASLRAGIAHTPEGAALAERLAAAAVAKFAALRAVVVEATAGHREMALALVEAPGNLRLTAEVRAAFAAFSRHAEAVKAPLMAQRDTNRRLVGLGTAALLLAALALVGLSALVFTRSARARRRASAAIAEQNSMLSLAGDLANIGHWRLNLPGHEFVWSSQMFAIYGRDPALGLPSVEEATAAYLPEYRDEVARTLALAIETGAGFEFTAWLTRGDGRIADVISRGICPRDAAGAVTSVFGIFLDITAIKRVQADLLESEQFLHGVLDRSPDAVMVFDRDGQFSFLNNKAVAMFDVGLLERADPSTGGRPRFQALWPAAKQAEIAAAIARDVTELNVVTQRKERVERQFRLLADHSRDVIMLRNATPGAPRKYASPACHDVLGYAPAAFCAFSFAETIHPDDLDRLEALYASLGLDCPSAQSVHRVRHRSMGWVWVEVVLSYVEAFDDGAEIRPVVVGSMRDISHRRQVEESLAHSERLYRLLAQNVTDVIMMTDAAGRLAFVSPSSARLLGRAPEALHGTCLEDIMHPDDVAGPSGHREYRLRHRDGA